MTELKTVAEGLEGTFNQMRVLLAGGTISKSPTGEAILEKLTEFQTKMSETFFKKKSEEEGSKKPIKSSETKKGSDKGTKRSRKGKDSESESESEKEEPKSNKKKCSRRKNVLNGRCPRNNENWSRGWRKKQPTKQHYKKCVLRFQKRKL